MLKEILEDCKKQLKAALKHKKHAFRYFSLATQAVGNVPHLRTVVLRDFDPDKLQFTIFTDSRSAKVAELKENDNAQLLFYDAVRLVQLVVEVKLIDMKENLEVYNALPEPTKKDYSSIQTPGSHIKSPDEVYHDFSKGYFLQIEFQAQHIEYLKLKRPNHLRVRFSKEDSWKGVFIAP